jgi:hypothetical protein
VRRVPVIYDAYGYRLLAGQIAERGLFGFASEQRTYGYPFFLAPATPWSWEFRDSRWSPPRPSPPGGS